MKILVDGVFFQLAQSGIARVWSTILPRLTQFQNVEIYLLNRGGCPSIPSIKYIDFPSYTATSTAADSFLIDEIGAHFAVDVFTSTYYTSPISIPSVLMVYDMIPEILDFDLTARMWQEKEIAISFARRFACISANTKTDLLKFYPEIANNLATVTYCGVDRTVFHWRSADETADFRRRYNLVKPYYMLVGSREQHKGYKNADLFFRAAKERTDFEFDILCVGGEPEISSAQLRGLPSRIAVRRLDLTDEELAQAYSGALALVFPSLYEGFGMPVIEAMACGCPVISTKYGSLGEVASDAAELITGHDVNEMVAALQRVRRAERRAEMIERGRARSTEFSWDVMAEVFHRLLKEAASERYEPQTQAFFAEWRKLRGIQAAVDTSV
jgi:glycosyltransferase involved in cell wall biosynthesis